VVCKKASSGELILSSYQVYQLQRTPLLSAAKEQRGIIFSASAARMYGLGKQLFVAASSFNETRVRSKEILTVNLFCNPDGILRMKCLMPFSAENFPFQKHITTPGAPFKRRPTLPPCAEPNVSFPRKNNKTKLIRA
jgi:hypothetical protein